MIEEYYLYTFESTHGAIATEKLMAPVGCTVMPVPRHISTSCGIAVRIEPEKRESAAQLFREKSDLSEEEYHLYHIRNDKSDKEHGFRYTLISG